MKTKRHLKVSKTRKKTKYLFLEEINKINKNIIYGI